MVIRLTKGIIYVKEFSEPLPKIVPKIEIVISALSLEELIQTNPPNLGHFLHPKFLEQTQELPSPLYCFLAMTKGKLVHLSRVEPFRQQDFIIRGSYTLEAYRGLNIATAVLVYIFHYLKENLGKKMVFISTQEDNLASNKSIMKAGFKRYKTTYRFSIGNKMFKWAI